MGLGFYKDESTKCMLYVILHSFILMSNMIFLCPGWIYKMIAICNIALVYSYVQHEFFMSMMNLLMYAISNIVMSRMKIQNEC